MEIKEIQQRIRQIKWFHSIDLGNGITTHGEDNTKDKLRAIKLPENLKGKTVLDIGAWDGFFSFEAERRGAKRVVAIDSYSWGGPGWGTKKGFDTAKQILNSKVEAVEMEVLDISKEKLGEFDIVLFLGVLYHMKHPLLALEKVFEVTKNLLILETHIDLINLKKPVMAFYPLNELNYDYSNWWGPNLIAVKAMLKTVGFNKIILIKKPDSFIRRIIKAIPADLKELKNFLKKLNQDRIVVHAYK